MTITEAIRGRASTRAFTASPVPRATIHAILETARWAPSGVNTQPWQVAVVSGALKQRIGDRIIAARGAGEKPDPDYQYYPHEFPQPCKARRVACGRALYRALGIERDDIRRRTDQWMSEELALPATLHLVCGIALGHPDPADPVNNYRTEREEVDTFTRWYC